MVALGLHVNNQKCFHIRKLDEDYDACFYSLVVVVAGDYLEMLHMQGGILHAFIY